MRTAFLTKKYQCCIQQFFWGGASFSTSVLRRKTIMQLGSLGQCCKPSPVGSTGKTLEICGYFAFWIAQNIALLALRQVDESLHLKLTLLSVWGFEFGIPNRYTIFKIAPDTALSVQCFYNVLNCAVVSSSHQAFLYKWKDNKNFALKIWIVTLVHKPLWMSNLKIKLNQID